MFFTVIIAIVVAAVLGAMLLYYGMTKYEGWLILAGFILCVAAAGTAVAYAILGVKYVAAGYKADIINREFHTNYTQAEVFFASDVIDTIRELDRKRIELNGSLMQWDQEDGDDQQNR